MGFTKYRPNTVAAECEAELWEYLIENDQVEDFYIWVEKYRASQDSEEEFLKPKHLLKS